MTDQDTCLQKNLKRGEFLIIEIAYPDRKLFSEVKTAQRAKLLRFNSPCPLSVGFVSNNYLQLF